MLIAFVTSALAAIAVASWFLTQPPSALAFKRRVYSLLEELGLDLDNVDTATRSEFALQCKAVHHATKRFKPKRLAIRLFTWHVTKQPFVHGGLKAGAAVTDSILTIQRWKRRDRSLDPLAQNDINKLVSFLSEELEHSHLPREKIIEAQINLFSLVNGTTVSEADLGRMADEIVEEHKRSIS
jgi:hypothetical protein